MPQSRGGSGDRGQITAHRAVIEAISPRLRQSGGNRGDRRRNASIGGRLGQSGRNWGDFGAFGVFSDRRGE
jgi:hypothetical protein